MQSAGSTKLRQTTGETSWRQSRALWLALATAAGVVLLMLLFYNLTRWPATWFDEGSHLHVPKTLVTEGVYADRSSEGFRYFGPTLGVGPTVMLPIALAFRIAGIGLLQARAVMALFMLAALGAFYLLARRMGGLRFALIAVLLLLAMRGGASTLQFGRQVLGEVPALFFLVAGLALWFGGDRRPSVARLALCGALIGLSIVTKSQFLLLIAPGLFLMWIANMIYYRAAPQRFYLIPGAVIIAVVAAWQAYQVFYLGPSTWSENFALLRAASAGAAFVFSPELMRASARELLSLAVFGGLLPLFVGYGLLKAMPRSRQGMQWGVILALIVCNLMWYLFASVGWIRYAYVGLALSTLCGAALFDDLFGAVHWEWRAWGRWLWRGLPLTPATMIALLAAGGLTVLIVAPLALTVRDIVQPPSDEAGAMASDLDRLVAKDAVIETWEPEMGFLTDHNYHYPPNGLLDTAVGFMWRGGEPPADHYAFVEETDPPYLLVGEFARWVHLYEKAISSGRYRLVARQGKYELYQYEAESSAANQTP